MNYELGAQSPLFCAYCGTTPCRHPVNLEMVAEIEHLEVRLMRTQTFAVFTALFAVLVTLGWLATW